MSRKPDIQMAMAEALLKRVATALVLHGMPVEEINQVFRTVFHQPLQPFGLRGVGGEGKPTGTADLRDRRG